MDPLGRDGSQATYGVPVRLVHYAVPQLRSIISPTLGAAHQDSPVH